MRLAFTCAALLVLFPSRASAADDRNPALAAPASATVAASATVPPGQPASSPSGEPAAQPLTAASNTLPPAPPVVITLKTSPQPHRFFDVRNSLGLAAMAATLSADAVSTQQGLAYPGFREINPVARPFVQTRAGGAVYSAGSFALLAGTMYVAHKKGLHKLERILPFAVAGWEGWLSARNYHVIGTKPR